MRLSPGCAWIRAGAMMAMLLLGLFAPASAMADGTWEYLGPSNALYPKSFFVTDSALYLGLSSGLYRYPFVTGEWELYAWGGYRINETVVWGSEDQNILLLIQLSWNTFWSCRTTNGGATWVSPPISNGRCCFIQSPSDTSRLYVGWAPQYSSDGGWTWHPSTTGFDNPDDVSFDPTSANVLYTTWHDGIWRDYISKSTDGGATWSGHLGSDWDFWEIDAERARPSHVMTSKPGISEVYVSSDGGATWFDQAAPGPSRAICCPVWSPASFFVAGADSSISSYAVWETSDLGATWTPHTEGLPSLEGIDWDLVDMFLVSHPTEPILFAALEGWGVWRLSLNPASVPPPSAADGSGLRLFVHPNPTPGEITYTISLPQPGPAVLRLFDVRGRLVETLLEEHFDAGRQGIHRRLGEGPHRLPSGTYYLELEAGGAREGRRIIVLR